MSKVVKRKISVELPKPRDLTKNRLSVFQRLGTKKSKAINISESKSIPDDLKQTLSAAVTISTKPISKTHTKPDNVELEDADPDILEKKRAEIQKELELQLKMESRKAAAKEAALRKRKHQRSSSSSSSSSSDSGSSSSSSSSSSSDDRHKNRKLKNKHRDSSSSSDDVHARRAAKKRMCQNKKEALKLQKVGHSKKILSSKSSKRSHSGSPALKKQRIASSSSSTVMINSKGQKVVVKNVKLSAEKHHRLREKEKEREKERERERERLRLREKELIRSRSPKLRPKSRSPKPLSRPREFNKQRTPPVRRASPRYRVGSNRLSRERERRDKERQDREAAREKERHEALARCQERQRERERLAKEKSRRIIDDEHPKMERLLPRPAERAMALAAARDRSRESIERDRHAGRSMEKEHLDAYTRGGYSEHQTTYTHTRHHEKDGRELERDYGSRHREEEKIIEREPYDEQKYDNHNRRDDRRSDYQTNYIEEQRHQRGGVGERERDAWIHDDAAIPRETYDRPSERHQATRDWEHNHRGNDSIPHTSNRENYSASREWTNETPTPKWENRKTATNWQQSESENWDRYNEENWQEPNQHPKTQSLQQPVQQQHAGRNLIVDNKQAEHNINIGGIGAGAGGLLGKGAVSRRWTNWRGRGRGNHHHNDFRRTNVNHHHHGVENFEERGEIYRRHINPQAAKNTSTEVSKPIAVQKPAEIPIAAVDKPAAEDITKNIEKIDETGGEEIADDLSEISDEADEILNQQELEQQEKALASDSNKVANLVVDTLEEQKNEASPKETIDTEKVADAEEATIVNPENASIIKSSEEISRPKDIIADDIDLDFEEISDGELEEEARIKGLGDALGVDWASLVEESKAITQEKSKKVDTSAKQCWQAHRILLDVGVSFKMAGQEFAKNVLIEAHQKLLNETNAERNENQEINVKIETVDDDVDEIEFKTEANTNGQPAMKLNEKRESNELIVETNKLQLHPLACSQVAARNLAHKRYNLVFNATGPYSRALCAKRDIAMRRQLCNLPISENNCKTTTAVPRQCSGYESIAIKLFRKTLSTTN